MKKLFILQAIFFSAVCFSQEKERGTEEVYTKVYHPDTFKEIMLSKRQKLMLYQLDSLSVVYNKNTFFIKTFYKDGRIDETFVRKTVKKRIPKKSRVKKIYNKI